MDFHGSLSTLQPITCGVPQDSILDPLPLIVCINDLPIVSNVFDCFLFADDTNLYVSGDNILTCLYDTINTNLDLLFDRFCVSKLFEFEKTNFCFPS